MRKRSKKQLINIICIVFLVLFLFTPLKFYLSIYLNTFIIHTPFVTPLAIEDKERVLLENYDWKLTDKKGIPFNLKKEKGNVICINFWATWCPPCVAEMPSFQELYHSYGDKVTFVFVAKDNIDKVNTFMEKKGYTLPVYYTTAEVPIALKHTSIPTTFLIDKSGKIVIKKSMAANWNSKEMTSILDKLVAE